MFRRNFFSSLFAGFAACFVPFKRKADAVEGTSIKRISQKYVSSGEEPRGMTAYAKIADATPQEMAAKMFINATIGTQFECIGCDWNDSEPGIVKLKLARVPQKYVEIDFGEGDA